MLTHWNREKWSSLGRRHFEMCFLEWKALCFGLNLAEIHPLVSSQEWFSVASNNDFVSIRQQTIIWTNDGLVYFRSHSLPCVNIRTWNRRIIKYFCIHMFCQWSVNIQSNLHYIVHGDITASNQNRITKNTIRPVAVTVFTHFVLQITDSDYKLIRGN